MRALSIPLLALSLAGCEHDPSAPPAPRREELTEPIVVRRGERELRVRCALDCDAARTSLDALQRACTADPRSTPHHVSTAASLVALGCCTESESAYREACGDEALAGCVSRWNAECGSGSLAPR